MVRNLEAALMPHLTELRVVLAAGEAAKLTARGLDPLVADCNYGPYDRTTWMDNCAKNLTKGGPVRLVKESKRRNWIEVDCEEGPIRFAPYIGSRDIWGRYRIHPKGTETYDLSGIQASLFRFEEVPAPTVPEVLYPYALRILKQTEEAEQFELHLILGTQPEREGRMSAKINYFGTPFIVTMGDGPADVAPVFESPFDPEGV